MKYDLITSKNTFSKKPKRKQKGMGRVNLFTAVSLTSDLLWSALSDTLPLLFFDFVFFLDLITE
jgi:hypothetical protein